MIDQLLKFESSASPTLFSELFNGSGAHLWNKFAHTYRGDLLSFIRSLDSDNLARLRKHLESN